MNSRHFPFLPLIKPRKMVAETKPSYFNQEVMAFYAIKYHGLGLTSFSRPDSICMFLNKALISPHSISIIG